jgi:hypothetical protein
MMAMTPKQAFRIVNRYFWDGIKELNFDANLYDRGIIKDDRTKKASGLRKKAHEAIHTLHLLIEEKPN